MEFVTISQIFQNAILMVEIVVSNLTMSQLKIVYYANVTLMKELVKNQIGLEMDTVTM